MQNINFNWLNLKPMKTSYAGLFWLLLLGSCTQLNKPAFDAKVEEEAIRSVLNTQQIAWNNGDLKNSWKATGNQIHCSS